MSNPYDISLLVTDDSGKTLKENSADKLRESSSTIKVPLLLLTFEMMAKRGTQLSETMERLPRHATKGSGILNWTEARHISFEDLIKTTLIYSDCLASNMLIDFVGGQGGLNSWIKDKGFKTRLLMPYLHFSGDEDYLPKVGTTTAREMLSLYKQIEEGAWPHDLKQLFNASASSINESWLELALPVKLKGLQHKTGSMINCGPRGETVYNAVGSYYVNGQKNYFCVLSHGRLKKDAGKSEEAMKGHVAKELVSYQLS